MKQVGITWGIRESNRQHIEKILESTFNASKRLSLAVEDKCFKNAKSLEEYSKNIEEHILKIGIAKTLEKDRARPQPDASAIVAPSKQSPTFITCGEPFIKNIAIAPNPKVVIDLTPQKSLSGKTEQLVIGLTKQNAQVVLSPSSPAPVELDVQNDPNQGSNLVDNFNFSWEQEGDLLSELLSRHSIILDKRFGENSAPVDLDPPVDWKKLIGKRSTEFLGSCLLVKNKKQKLKCEDLCESTLSSSQDLILQELEALQHNFGFEYELVTSYDTIACNLNFDDFPLFIIHYINNSVEYEFSSLYYKIDHLSQVRVEFEQRLLRYNNITASVCVEEFVQVTNPPLDISSA